MNGTSRAQLPRMGRAKVAIRMVQILLTFTVETIASFSSAEALLRQRFLG